MDYWGYASNKPKKGGSDVGGCPPGMICGKQPDQDQVATFTPQPRSAPDWHEFPSGIFGPGFAGQPNMTQPLVQPDINRDRITDKERA